MESRLQNLDDKNNTHPQSSPHHHTHEPTNRKGKGPMTFPPQTSPIPVAGHSSSSSSSSSHSATQIELAACISTAPTPVLSHPSSDSEATRSDPPTPPTAPSTSPPQASISTPSPTHQLYPPHQPSPPPPQHSTTSPPPPPPVTVTSPPPTVSPSTSYPTYQCRKLMVSRPKSSSPSSYLLPHPLFALAMARIITAVNKKISFPQGSVIFKFIANSNYLEIGKNDLFWFLRMKVKNKILNRLMRREIKRE